MLKSYHVYYVILKCSVKYDQLGNLGFSYCVFISKSPTLQVLCFYFKVTNASGDLLKYVCSLSLPFFLWLFNGRF
jgi:hypothetical protein